LYSLISNEATSPWLPAKTVHEFSERFDDASALNIFTINNPNTSSSVGSTARHAFQDIFRNWSRPPAQWFVLDPGARQQRREVQKWRQWHEVFCVLNEIEQRLAEAIRLLMQAAGSMRQFGKSHSELSDCIRLSLFLRDAALYFGSESEVPSQLETNLAELERIADEFRRLSIQELMAADLKGENAIREQLDLQRTCEDLQVDIAVLLESALMTAQHALAEYKKMHCRLELLATEYKPVCALELDGPTFLPLIADESSTQVAAAAVPEQAVQWAVDFSNLVGAGSHGLDGLVRELEQRVRQLKSCSNELRAQTLQRASCGVLSQC